MNRKYILLLAGLLFACAHAGLAQKITVKGTVTDAQTDEPLPGANVVLKGTTTGTSTDENGKYELVIPSTDDTLVVSYIGYQTRTVPIRGREIINISLKPQEIVGENLVIIGYGEQEKISITGAVTHLEAPDQKLGKISQPSVVNMLAGQIPGIITRQSSGEPGYSAAQIFIRGKSSFHNNHPLVLVNGVPRGMNSINPYSIKSITVLKDASATAVYGARGANGVILIKTKRGQPGKPHVTFRTEAGRLTALRLPNYIGAVEYAKLVNEANTRVGLNPIYTSQEMQLFKNGSKPYLYPSVDWVDKVLKKQTFQSINNLSVSGGGESIQYYINLAFTTKEGIYEESSLNNYKTNATTKRYNFRANITADLSENLSMFLGLGGIIFAGHYPNQSSQIFRSLKISTPIQYPVTNPDGSIAGGPSYKSQNPWGVVTQSGYVTQEKHTVQSTLRATWDLSSLVTKGLSLEGQFAYDYYNFAGINRYITFPLKLYLGKGPNGEDQYKVVREGKPMGYDPWTNTNNRTFHFQASLKYDRTFLGKHDVGAMLVLNQRNHMRMAAGSSIEGLPYRDRGLSGRLTYGYDERYMVAFNFGYTGSENFAEGQRYGFFPSFSAGWIVSNEEFWNVPFISFLKLRASWGQVGNDNIGGERFLYLSTVSKNANNYWFGATQQWYSGFDEGAIGNAGVTWETSIKKNIGLNIRFWEDKITLQANFFSELRKNILLQRQSIPRVTGFFPWIIPYANLGRVRNQGFDGQLKIQNSTSGGLYYSFRANFTYAHNEVLKNDEPPKKYAYQSAIGHSLGAPFGLKALGFFDSREEIKKSPEQAFSSMLRPGDIRYADINGDGVVDAYDRIYLDGYSRTPEIMFGLGGAVAWKGFEFSVFFTGATHTSLFLQNESIWPFLRGPGTYNILEEYYNNRWTPETKKTAEYPAVIPGQSTNNFRRSSIYMKDASYIRWKSATLGYTLPVEITQKLGMSSLKFYINATNIITFDYIDFMNPETNSGTGFYPLQRGIMFGMKFEFN